MENYQIVLCKKKSLLNFRFPRFLDKIDIFCPNFYIRLFHIFGPVWTRTAAKSDSLNFQTYQLLIEKQNY